jgi:drug/metabolite transporter (DMT)-like permease
MTVEILLALVASLFTASAAVAQRVAAAPAAGELTFSWRLVIFLLRRPMWFLGVLCMIAGFLCQLAALHFGDLSLVQPVIATELLFVFGYLAVRGRRQHRVQPRDWVAATGMAVGLGTFLFLAHPSGGSTTNATTWRWILAGASTLAAVIVVGAVAIARTGRGTRPSPSRKAALLGVVAGMAWGFAAAVIKELSLHVGQGPYAIFTNWSPYVLILTGAIATYLVGNAFQAGPLAASQPGLTLVDPLVASVLGVTLFGEHIRTGAPYLAGEVIAGLVLVGSVILLARSPLIQTSAADDEGPVSRERLPGAGAGAEVVGASGAPPSARPPGSEAPVTEGTARPQAARPVSLSWPERSRSTAQPGPTS